MKTTHCILTIIAFFIVTIGFATEVPKMNIIKVENEKALLAFEVTEPTIFELTITNNAGNIVYFKRSENALSNYRKILNLSDLKNGTYNISFNYGNKSVNRDLHLKNGEITVGPKVQLIEPYFTFDNNKLYLSFLNVAQKSVYLNVYEDGEFISGTNLGKDMTIHKCIDFSKLNKGDFKVVVSDHFKDHSYMVSK